MAHALTESSAALWARMDATERFAADVAHEIKNPLTSIRSAIETLRRVEDPGTAAAAAGDYRGGRDPAGPADQRHQRCEPGGCGAVAGGDGRRWMSVKLLETLAEIHDATRPAGGPVLQLDLPGTPLVVAAVEGRLVQVLRNLIGNAISFSPPDGTIVLRGREAAPFVEISIDDEGPGIPPAKLEHVFDRFYTERPVGELFGKHSGLGLSISRQIVDALKGRISAENRVGADGKVVGARFTVVLPQA